MNILFLLLTAVSAEKFKICHNIHTHLSNWHTITVNENAVQAHLEHGDLYGSCNEHCDILCPPSDLCKSSRCDNDSCLSEVTVNCDDGLTCTTDDCDPFEGCVYNSLNCDDSNLCTADFCFEPSGCVHFPAFCLPTICQTTTGCNPTTGNCEYLPLDCDDNDPCTEDTCDPVEGCVHTNICVPEYNCLCSLPLNVDSCVAPVIAGYYRVTFEDSLNNVGVLPTQCAVCTNLGCLYTPYTTADYNDCVQAYGC